MTCFLLAASFRPFQRRRFPVRSRSKKKKNDFCGPLPAHGGFVLTPRTPYSYAPAVNPNSLTFLETTPTEIYKILSTLKTNKAAGLNNIPAALLKFCAPGISKSLTCLFNRSFELSEFPTAWKEAMVIPIFKKGSHTDPGNYRPIALLPIITKVESSLVM